MDGNQHMLIHLDLKGAPPKLNYLEQIFPLFKKWEATGLLIEYEDMFPYSGKLEPIKRQHSYTENDIAKILKLAEVNGLTVIPLIQTFGHFEFVLKHEEFSKYREHKRYPNSICPSHEESIKFIGEIIDQVLRLHPGIKWFHIGCDEVYLLGGCDKCKERMDKTNTQAYQLYTEHVKAVAEYISKKYPSVRPIIWDDMLRTLPEQRLTDSGLGSLVDVMVWHYLPQFVLPPYIWDRFSKVFKNIWFASAFKGATGPCVSATNIQYHIDNHLAWLEVVEKEKSKFENFQGLAITGWQRYDHYAILCELLPAALPSLALCMQVLKRKAFLPDIHQFVSQDLGFKGLIPVDPFKFPEIPVCLFPGHQIYQGMQEVVHMTADFEEFINGPGLLSWFNDYNIKINHINEIHVELFYERASKLLEWYNALELKLKPAFREIFFEETTEEWFEVYMKPKMNELSRIIAKAEIILK